jgi:hypothetical protein
MNLYLTSDGYVPSVREGGALYVRVDLRDEQSLARAFSSVNHTKHSTFLSSCLKVPPDPVKNLYNSLVYFRLPKSMLDRKLRLFIIVSSYQVPHTMKHQMPFIPIGSTDTLDQDLKYILQ